MKKRVCLLFVCLVSATALLLACGGPAATTTKPPAANISAPTTTTLATAGAQVAPRYGGRLKLMLYREPLHFDSAQTIGGNDNGISLVNQGLTLGDWSRGLAGGYGTGKSDFRGQYDIWEMKTGNIADSWKWWIDAQMGEAFLVFEIRQGLHWGLNPNNEASRMVGGREITADDVVFNFKRTNYDPRAYLYGNLGLRAAEITKTGPWEVTIKVKPEYLADAICRFSGALGIEAPEVIQKYGDARDAKNSVSSGPFMLTDYVAGSAITLDRNPSYWGKDPVGPGKGNQLPYLDGVDMFIITDSATRLAALRTGKIDQSTAGTLALSWEDAADLRKTAPGMIGVEAGPPNETGPMFIYMNTTKAPYNDVRVRQAISMALDREAIRKSVNGGNGRLLSWPHSYAKDYAGIYLGLDDPDTPDAVKEVYTYNPDKAKELLAVAGYPSGFKTRADISSTYVEDFSLYADYLSKVSIQMDIHVIDLAVSVALRRAGGHEAMVEGGHGPIGVWYLGTDFSARSEVNASMVDDPVVNAALAKIKLTLVTEGTAKAMAQFRDMLKYLLPQCYVIDTPHAPGYTFWWPWVKNYSGETTVGYYLHPNWATWVWYDQDLKRSMGH